MPGSFTGNISRRLVLFVFFMSLASKRIGKDREKAEQVILAA
jgi:hypothetical protein